MWFLVGLLIKKGKPIAGAKRLRSTCRGAMPRAKRGLESAEGCTAPGFRCSMQTPRSSSSPNQASPRSGNYPGAKLVNQLINDANQKAIRAFTLFLFFNFSLFFYMKSYHHHHQQQQCSINFDIKKLYNTDAPSPRKLFNESSKMQR